MTTLILVFYIIGTGYFFQAAYEGYLNQDWYGANEFEVKVCILAMIIAGLVIGWIVIFVPLYDYVKYDLLPFFRRK